MIYFEIPNYELLVIFKCLLAGVTTLTAPLPRYWAPFAKASETDPSQRTRQYDWGIRAAEYSKRNCCDLQVNLGAALRH
jgi:hypothetical protein